MRLWGRILTNGRELPASRIELADGQITEIEAAHAPPSGTDMVVNDGWIAPGLIDLQVNGAGGADLTSAEDPATALAHVARVLASHGVTAFCPTIVSSPVEVITRCLRAYRPHQTEGGAEALGLHIEGPFIDPEHRGVHDPANLRPASTEEINAWLENGIPAIVTVAPERPGCMAAIEAERFLEAEGH